VSGLFLLAKPSTPETAKQEAASRADAGEPITLNTVKEMGRAKQDDRRNARVEVETRRDAGKQHKDAGRANQSYQPHVERWFPQSDGLIETRVLWPIQSAQHHLEDAMRGLKVYKSRMSEADMDMLRNAFLEVYKLAKSGGVVVKMSEAGMDAVGNAFLDVFKLTYRGADVEEPTK
jgi:hypothetical protein